MGKVGAEPGEVGLAFRLFLRALLQLHKPRFVLFETPYMPPMNANPATLLRLFGMAWELDVTCEEYGVTCYQKPTASFVKFMTGEGRYPDRAAKKAATIAACKARGWDVGENEADALALLMYGESVLFPKESKARGLTLKQPEGPLFPAAAA
jgi:hypothetical protein